MSQNALKRNLWECIFVYKASAFLRSSAAAHLSGKDNSSLGRRMRLKKSSESCQKLHHAIYQRKTNPQHSVLPFSVNAQFIKTQMYSIFGWDTCPHCESHLSQVLQGDPCLHFPASLLRPPLVRAALLSSLHQNKTGRCDPAAWDEDVGGRRQMARAGGQRRVSCRSLYLLKCLFLLVSAPCLSLKHTLFVLVFS